MNTVMKNQIDCSIEFGISIDWRTVLVRVKQILSSMGVSVSELDDLAQEVCMKIIGRKVRVGYMSWLRVVARNVVADFYRREFRRADYISSSREFTSYADMVSASADETDYRLASVPNPRKEVLEFDFKEAIVQEFTCLELTQRQTMYLGSRHFFGQNLR